AFTPDSKTAFVANYGSGTVSVIDVKTRTKNPTDIPVGAEPGSVALTPDRQSACVTHLNAAVPTFDVKSRIASPGATALDTTPAALVITADGKTAFVANFGSPNSVSTIDLRSRTKNPTDIPVGSLPFGMALTPCRR